MNTKVIWNSIPQIGYYARTATKGEEYDMVIRFVNAIKEKYDARKTKHAVIFVEPQIESGYPDIVIVEYNNRLLFEDNGRNRKRLSQTDLKILMQMQIENFSSVSKMSNILGFDNKTIAHSAKTLSDLGLLYFSPTSGAIRKVSQKKWCAINRVVSIEAKINRWGEAITQAVQNKWFATDSYVLLNKKLCSSSVAEKCQELGIGVLLFAERIDNPVACSHDQYPISYASLLFYEWIQRLFTEDIENEFD